MKAEKGDLEEIPGIGRVISKNLGRIGIFRVEDFRGKDAEILYQDWCKVAEQASDLDRCVLYLFREAIYYAEGGRDPEFLKWWNWKEKEEKTSLV
jgi:hypothetical protein